jgi:hypothetical protein
MEDHMTYRIPELVSIGAAQNLVLGDVSDNNPTCRFENGTPSDTSHLTELW